MLWKSFKKFVNKVLKGGSPKAYNPAVVDRPSDPMPMPPRPSDDIPWLNWCRYALDISQRFEGDDPWANITGNFDGVGLTCGALGWTMQWDNQQPLVREFVRKYGIEKLISLMPIVGKDYWNVCNLTTSKAVAESARWSNGANVKQPYKRELQALWKSPEMIQIQIDVAWKQMGKFAQEMCLAFQQYHKLDRPLLQHFCFWFDQAVQNGTGKLIPFYDADKKSINDIMNWLASETGAGSADTRKNHKLWKDLLNSPAHELHLLKLGVMRSQRANDKWDTDVANRRGTLALGQGYVHGKLYTFDWL